jgi:integrase
MGTAQSTIKLTRKDVDAAIAGWRTGTRERHWFEAGNGLYLAISKKGVASYTLRYRRPDATSGDCTLGRASTLTPEQAWDEAIDVLAGLRKGTDPNKVRRDTKHSAQATREAEQAARVEAERKSITFAALYGAYKASPEHSHSKRTDELHRGVYRNHLEPLLGQRPISELTRRDIKDCVRAVQAEAAKGSLKSETKGFRTANLAHALVKAVFNWAIEDERCETNPASFKKLFDETPKKRIGVLNDDRVRVIWQALETEIITDRTRLKAKPKDWNTRARILAAIGVKLCWLTLQRPNEVLQAHRNDFDKHGMMWHIPEDRTKTNAAYEVPLTEQTLALFDEAFALAGSDWAFPHRLKHKALERTAFTHRFDRTRKNILKAAPKSIPSDVQLYDGRRFGRTRLEEALGFPQHICEAVLNHAGDQGMGRRYVVSDYRKQIRAAHEVWVTELHRIVMETDGGH